MCMGVWCILDMGYAGMCSCVCMHVCASINVIACECGSVSPAVTQSAAAACSVP